MKKRNFQKPARMGAACEVFEQAGKGFGMGFQTVVYSDFSGLVLKVSFLGNQWWVTTPGERLQPLEKYFNGAGIGFCVLCVAGGKVGALALACFLGKAIEEPEYGIADTLQQRVNSLRCLGVELEVKDEPLRVELEVFENPERSHRMGKYSAWCSVVGDSCTKLFDLDGFPTKHDAEAWAETYFEFLKSQGIDVTIF